VAARDPGLDPENPFLLSNRDLVSRLETKASPILGWQDQPTLLIETSYPA
jgi:hypothetical protein